MTTIEFMRPRFQGARFEGGAIPLEVLRDLAVLEEMLIEVAKWRFLQDHPVRHRSPRGFAEKVELRLTRVEEGSVVLLLTLFIDSPHLLPGLDPNLIYCEQAREAIVSAIQAAEKDQTITDHLPEKALGYFDRLGRSLRDGEVIELTTVANPTPAHLNKETRRKLVLASPRVQELTEEVTIRGSIPQVDQEAMSFQMMLFDGRRVKAPMTEQHRDTVLDAFNGYRDGARVMLQGIGKFDRQNRLQSLESVEHITPLEPLDVTARLDEFRRLRDGWLEGKGVAPSHNGLDWLATTFDRYFPDDLPLPHIYPTAEGGVQAEWSLGANEVSLEVDLSTHKGEWHRLDLVTDVEDLQVLELDNEGPWVWLITEIRFMIEITEMRRMIEGGA